MQTKILKIEKIISEVQSTFKVPAISVAIVGKGPDWNARGFGSLSPDWMLENGIRAKET